MAAQAYSPSDAMSQARFCLGRMKKVQRRPGPTLRAIFMLKRGLAADVSGRDGGADLQQRVSIDVIALQGSPPVDCQRLFLTRWIRLPRRHMGSRWRVRPDRLRHPRGLRGPAEAQAPCEEMGAILLKYGQDGFVGDGNLYMHAASHNVPHLDGRFR